MYLFKCSHFHIWICLLTQLETDDRHILDRNVHAWTSKRKPMLPIPMLTKWSESQQFWWNIPTTIRRSYLLVPKIETNLYLHLWIQIKLQEIFPVHFKSRDNYYWLYRCPTIQWISHWFSIELNTQQSKGITNKRSLQFRRVHTKPLPNWSTQISKNTINSK